MNCHNQSSHDDYLGGGLENPHPFAGAATLKCTTCHGGNPQADVAPLAHVPPPPEIGDEAHQIQNREAYFNRLTLTGIDRYGPYEVNGVTYSALDYLQFVNPGDMRVVSDGRSCGSCHMAHVECVEKSPLATATGIFSGAMFAIGQENQVAGQQGLYQDTAADLSFRSVLDPNYFADPSNTGAVEQLIEFPVYSVFNDTSPHAIHKNPDYDAANLPNGQDATTRRLIRNRHDG